jgi:hypothetical protein
VAISHSLVLVKLFKWLDGFALKTLLHDWLLKAHHIRFD